MFTSKKTLLLIATILMVAVLAACSPQTVEVTRVVPQEVTRVVTETVEVEGEAVEVTRIVTETIEVEVPAETEAPGASLTDPSPDTLVQLTFGDIDTMDPALAYDTASGQLLENVMEGLIYYNHKDGTTYVPQLATEVPSEDNGGISEDGLTYTWNIREGVTYHEGGTLEPHDVAYTFQRGLLQSDPNGPQWLLLEPFFDFATCHDITEAIDPECNMAGDRDALAAYAAENPEEVIGICETVKEKVVADDDAGTVTMNLDVPWGPMLATLAQSWGFILDSEWAIEQGAWDGECDGWWEYYSPGSENSELTEIVNGTGPYILDHWTPGEEYALVANPNYWRTEPIWEGGPSGVARIENVIVRIVNEWGTRFAALQAGDAEFVAVNLENYPQVDPLVAETCDWQTDECEMTGNPQGFLRAYPNRPEVSKSHMFMVWDIPTDSPYIGSGQLDGNGIPTDFFADINVRRAMHYCFDYDTYIAEAQNGLGVRTNGPIIRDMLGYNEDGPMYEYDLDACAAELEQAHGGVLPEVGFRVTVAFNTGNTARQVAGEMLQSALGSINPLYQVDILGLPWPTFLRQFRAGQIPMLTSGWIEDIHDPHNWVQPFTTGTYGGRQRLPQEILDKYRVYVEEGVAAADPAERERIYFEMQQAFYDDAISVPLSQAATTNYQQPWVCDYYYRVGAFGAYFYALGLTGQLGSGNACQ
jgi:peptide/nickel transport system substrate-binding protein